MRILVTGASGFIGSSLVPMLREAGHQVAEARRYVAGRWDGYQRTKDRVFFDLRDTQETQAAVMAARPEVILHLAAQSAVTYSFDHPQEVNEVNYMGTLRVAEAARELGAHLVLASSSEVYGASDAEVPFTETSRLGATSPYCLSPETRVLQPDGSTPSIKDANTRLVCFDFANHKVTHSRPLEKLCFPYHGPMLEIRTAAGGITATPEHGFFVRTTARNRRPSPTGPGGHVKTTEVRAKDLKPGDRIAALRVLPVEGKPWLGERLCRFFGYFTGDGCVKHQEGKSYTISLADRRLDLLNQYRDLLQSLEIENRQGSISMHLYKHGSKDCWYLDFCSKPFSDFLKSLGLLCHSNMRRVPPELFKASNEEVASFLAGLYDAEGFGRSHLIVLGSSSFGLVEDCGWLLRRFGIVSTIRAEKDRPGHGQFWKLTISEGYSRQLFHQHIPTFKPIKDAPVQEVHWRKNGGGQVYWAAINRITQAPNASGQVYDYQVSVYRNYVANGFIVHNSVSKMAAEEYLRVLHQAHHLPMTILRPFNSVGRAPVNNRHFVVERAITQALEQGHISLHDPRPLRDFVHREDHCRAYCAVIEHLAVANGQTFNICTGDAWSIGEMAQYVADAVKYRLGRNVTVDFGQVPDRPLDIPVLQGSASRAKALLGWEPRYTIAQGLDKAVEEWQSVLNK